MLMGWIASYHNFNRFNRRALRTTETEENAIAPPAKIGLKRICKNGYKTPAATGIKIIL